MFMKQYNYKPRSNSTSSTGSQGAAAQQETPKTASVAEQAQGATAAAAQSAGRRRSSASADKFAGLSGYKRSSQDHSDKKASFADQKVGGGGVLGGMWNTFTKGS